MGTTLTAIQNGAGVFVYAIRIEGYPYIIASTSDTSAVVTAFSGSGYTQALGGLYPPGNYEQRIEPFSDSIDSGSMTFTVAPDASETFAKDLFTVNKNGGGWARLDTNADPSDLAFVWADTTDLASSGTLYIGNEDTAYSGKTSTTTTGHTRASHTPMTDSGGDGFARQYKIGITSGEQTSYPYATDWKRNWVGSWVVCTVHRVVEGVIDTLAQAETVFTGTIAEIQDDPANVARLVCVDALEKLNTATLLSNQWSAEPIEGIYFPSHTIVEVYESATDSNASPITSYGNTVTMSFDGTYISEGKSTIQEVILAINAWLRAEWNSSNIENLWFFRRSNTTSKTIIEALFNSTTASPSAANMTAAVIKVRMSTLLAGALGFDIEGATVEEIGTVTVSALPAKTALDISGLGNTTLSYTSAFTYAHSTVWPDIRLGATTPTLIGNVSGSFVNQRTDLPNWLAIGDQSAGTWGIVRFRGYHFVVKLTGSSQMDVLVDPRLSQTLGDPDVGTRFVAETGAPPRSNDVYNRITDPVPTYKQVVIIQNSLDYIMLRMFASTGDAGFNHATYDAWDAQLSIDGGLPWSVLGDTFVNSVLSLAQRTHSSTMTLLLDRPTRAVEILLPELIIRSANFVMDDGAISIATPTQPPVTGADHTITTSDRVAPDGRGELPDSTMSKDFIVTEVNVEYDRGPDGRYRSDASVINSQASADFGISRKLNLKLRNHYTIGQVDSRRNVLELLAQLSGDVLAFFGRPILIASRTVGMDKAHEMVPGDTLFVTDDYIRDVETGARGVSGRPGWLLGITKRYGAEGMLADAVIALHDNDIARTSAYVPAGQINDTVTGGGFAGGYNSTTDQIEIYTDAFSLTTEDDDVAHFGVGDKLTIIEQSPATPGSPQSWSVGIDAISGNVIDLDAALTGFDSNKKYYIHSAAYGTAQTSQKSNVFMGDNTVGRVVADVRNFAWAKQKFEKGSFSAAVTTDRFEYPVSDGTWDSDGSPVTPVIHRNGVRAANLLNTRLTAPQCPMRFYAGVSTTSTSYVVAAFPFPFYLGDYESFEFIRKINCGPILEQTTSGTGTVRVTSSASAPVYDGALGSAMTVSYLGEAESVEFTNTSLTYTNVTGSTVRAVKSLEGPWTWITIEMKTSANTSTFYGMHEFWLGPPEIV